MADNSPKHLAETWLKLKMEYEAGSYTSLKELALRYGVLPGTLRRRVCVEKWNERQIALLNKVERRFEERTVDQASEYLKKSFLTSQKYEKLVEVSMEQLSAKDSQGNHIIDPDSLDTYSKISQRSQAMAVVALRIAPAVQQVEVSGNIQHSLVQTIQRLREGKEVPQITKEQVQGYIDVEILPKAPTSP